MRFCRVYAIFLRQLYLLRGSYTRIVPLFVWVAIDMVLWGFLTRYLNSVASSGFDFVPTLLGAVLMWDFFTRVMQGVTMAFFEDVWSRNFLDVFATPLTVPEYVTGLVISSIATSTVGLVVMLILADAVFGLSFLSYGITLLPLLLALFLFGIAVGIVGVSVVLRFGPAAEWFIWPMPALISPFVGVFYPISVLPAWMQAFSRILPPSYVFEALRALVQRQEVSPGSAWAGAGLALMYVAAAGWLFSLVFRHAVKSGLLARYSAETVG